MSRRCMLTTFDNPFNPFDDFKTWYLYDIEKGYGTSDYLGRIARTSDGLSETENNEEIERAIDAIIRVDFLNLYRKVYEDDPESFERLLKEQQKE